MNKVELITELIRRYGNNVMLNDELKSDDAVHVIYPVLFNTNLHDTRYVYTVDTGGLVSLKDDGALMLMLCQPNGWKAWKMSRVDMLTMNNEDVLKREFEYVFSDRQRRLEEEN